MTSWGAKVAERQAQDVAVGVLIDAQGRFQGYRGTGRNITAAKRAVLLGAQASSIAFGKGYSFENFDWNEELFDYGNQLGVEAGAIFGLKKLRFNSKDFGSIVAATFTS